MSQELKLVSWNVNGIRAVLKKGFMEYFTETDADLFALQEIKLSEGQLDLETPGYHQYWNYAERKGYSGTAVFSKQEPISVRYGFDGDRDNEGRITALEFEDFWFVNVYTPNSQDQLKRIGFRMSWDDAFSEFLRELNESKPVITCGDFNVAHHEIDLKNPGPNRGKAGFSDEEREKFGLLLDSGYTDTFRHFYPDATGAYSWWSYRFRARDTNAGWRIDYFLTSTDITDKLIDARIRDDVFGSDHCPVELILAV